MTRIELGLDTFGDITLDADGRPKSHAQVLRDTVAQAELADRLGVDFIGVGEQLEDLQTFSAREFAQALLT